MTHDVFRDGKVHVLRKRCSTCIFRGGNLMHLMPGRVKDMVRQAVAADSVIVCHQTLEGPNAACRGYLDAFGDRVYPIRLAAAMSLIKEVDVMK